MPASSRYLSGTWSFVVMLFAEAESLRFPDWTVTEVVPPLSRLVQSTLTPALPAGKSQPNLYRVPTRLDGTAGSPVAASTTPPSPESRRTATPPPREEL